MSLRRTIRPRRGGGFLLATLVLALAVCGRDGFPDTPADAPPAYDLTGRYAGTLELEGEVVDASLTLAQEQGRLTGSLVAPIGLDAEARGILGGDRLVVEFDYDAECDGEGRMEGRALDGGRRLIGRFTAEDCTGRVEGGFTFVRSG